MSGSFARFGKLRNADTPAYRTVRLPIPLNLRKLAHMQNLAIEGHAPEWTLTDRLRKAREYRGLSQAELADLTGVSARSVFNYEAGRTTPRRPQLIAWALATGVCLDWLENDVRPKGLEPPTFWLGVWRRLRFHLCRAGRQGHTGAVRTDDLALAA